VTSGDLSQLIAALWSVGEQIRDPQYGNDVKGLRDVAHRNHLKKLGSGRLSAQGTVTSLSDCRGHSPLFRRLLFASPKWTNEKEISHGRVSWQTRWSRIRMGPLASSIV
jgi:hypothetical protein